MAHTHRNLALLLAALLIVLAAPVRAQTAEPAYDHPLFTGPIHEAPTARFDQEHLRLALRFDDDARRAPSAFAVLPVPLANRFDLRARRPLAITDDRSTRCWRTDHA